MSKKNNVNPDFYKTAGREHTDGSDKADPHTEKKQKLEKDKEKVLPGHKDEKK